MNIKVNLTDLLNWTRQVESCSDNLENIPLEYKKILVDTNDLYTKAKSCLEQKKESLRSTLDNLEQREQQIVTKQQELRSAYNNTSNEEQKKAYLKFYQQYEEIKEQIQQDKQVATSQYYKAEEKYQQLIFYEKELAGAIDFGDKLYKTTNNIKDDMIDVAKLMYETAEHYKNSI